MSYVESFTELVFVFMNTSPLSSFFSQYTEVTEIRKELLVSWQEATLAPIPCSPSRRVEERFFSVNSGANHR